MSYRVPGVGESRPLNPNRVLRSKTDDEGAEDARGLRGRPRARAGRVWLGRRQWRRRCGHDDQRHNDRGRRLQPLLSQAKLSTPGAVSSVGRAPARQAGGHWFEPSTAHLTKAPLRRGFSLVPAKVRFASVVAVAAKWLRSSDETAPSWAGWRAERPGRFPLTGPESSGSARQAGIARDARKRPFSSALLAASSTARSDANSSGVRVMRCSRAGKRDDGAGRTAPDP